ncbi:unnamed protein product [Tetraodon nigroviridis]|uniref:(spotted green pufferfish) hypothetical protein n=1 Tax=Tetraodon nigroviridis TaxID=99883 RepID=Q4SZN4_TETNG|nr:unnamed protein product [Tetraodon nigroviridis]
MQRRKSSGALAVPAPAPARAALHRSQPARQRQWQRKEDGITFQIPDIEDGGEVPLGMAENLSAVTSKMEVQEMGRGAGGGGGRRDGFCSTSMRGLVQIRQESVRCQRWASGLHGSPPVHLIAYTPSIWPAPSLSRVKIRPRTPALLVFPWQCHRACPAHCQLPTLGQRMQQPLHYLSLAANSCSLQFEKRFKLWAQSHVTCVSAPFPEELQKKAEGEQGEAETCSTSHGNVSVARQPVSATGPGTSFN